MLHPLLRRPGLYAITDGPRDDLLAAVRAALQGGAALLQYRDKISAQARKRKEAAALARLCQEFATAFIVNDDVEFARGCNATGVHLGEDDARISEARAALGSHAIIGISCYDSIARARDAAAAGADYLAFGAFFPSPTKPGARHATPQLLRSARELGKPLVAIGGITPDNGGALIEAGADFLAAISGVFAAHDIRVAAQRFGHLFESTKTHR